MKLLLIMRSAKAGTPPVKKTLVAPWGLRVGRNASCEIHLPDPRIALEQGMIVNRSGLIYMEGETAIGNTLSTMSTHRRVRSLRLKIGADWFDVGPYRMRAVAAPEGYDGAVEIELTEEAQAVPALASRASELTLGSLGLTKRWAAWAWGITVLVLFLLIPAGRVLHLPWAQAASTLGIGDRFWNPGPVMLAHQPIAGRCAACHEVAFQHVKDGACLECHSKIGRHGVTAGASPQFQRCTACHLDHKGVKTTHRDDDAFCVACHRDLVAHAKGTLAANAVDFARDHPAFRLALPDEGAIRRVRQGGQPIVEKSNLVFPHAVHLDPNGVRSPVQGRMKLKCDSCHQPDASRRGFEPISMRKHCQECHALQFEPAVTTREVPHGDPAEAVQVIEEFYASLALKGTPDSFQKAFGVPGEGLLRRVGEPSAGERQAALTLASRKAAKVSKELFEARVCMTCHAVTLSSDPSPKGEGSAWKIAPVRANNRWMPHAEFDHKAHGQAKCADCHDVAMSKRSSDVAMPTIQKCRECHGGSKPVEGKLTSNCLLCHGFHDSKHPWDPNFRPRNAQRVAESEPRAR